MVNSPELVVKGCFRCSSGILMPDGNTWCGITNKPESAIGCSYSPGLPKLYKPERVVIQKVLKEKLVTKTTISIPKVKTIPTKQKPISSSKKTTSPQIRLF